MKLYKSLTSEIVISCEKTEHYIQKRSIKSSGDSYNTFKEIWPYDLNHRESFMALYLNRQNNTVGYHLIGVGGLASTVADGKIVFQGALQCNSSAIILAHNHPSGNMKPSRSDEELTRKLKEFGNYIDLIVLDHLIISDNSYFSFADEGIM